MLGWTTWSSSHKQHAAMLETSPFSFWIHSTYSLHHIISSVTQSCPNLCDPMDRSTPGLPVHHQLPEFTQTLVHWVSDAIQPSYPLSSPSPPAFNLSQHQVGCWGLVASDLFSQTLHEGTGKVNKTSSSHPPSVARDAPGICSKPSMLAGVNINL